MNATNMRCVAHRNHLFTMESEVINSYMRVKAVADAARQGLTYNALQAPKMLSTSVAWMASSRILTG